MERVLRSTLRALSHLEVNLPRVRTMGPSWTKVYIGRSQWMSVALVGLETDLDATPSPWGVG